MKKQIISFSIFHNALLVAILSFITLVIIFTPYAIYAYHIHDSDMLTGSIIMPFLGSFIHFFITAFVLWIYNLIAPGFGGIEFRFKDSE